MPSKTNATPQHAYATGGLERLRVEQRADALVDREAGAEHEDADRGEQRPEVALHAVAERVPAVGRLLAALERGQQEDLVDRVGDRVRRLASIADDPESRPPTSFATAIARFAAPATSTVPVDS